LKRTIVGIYVIYLALLQFSCNTTDPPNNERNISLKLEDVSCTETWITLTTNNLQRPATVTLKQTNSAGDTKSKILHLNTQDSLLYIDSLFPNQTYQYQASSIPQSGGQNPATSNELSVTTMDTTSHNFTFETFTFGGTAGSSTLYDVAIINEDYIIAVGNVFLPDSLGQPDPQPYGLAIWNGQSWKLKKIFHSTNIPVTPRGIFVTSPTEIYLASGSIFRWDGSSSTVQLVYSRLNFPDPNATIEKLWGSSGSSIYGVGNVGSIVYYNGTNWHRIESGTDVALKDIFGTPDGKSVWAAGYEDFKPTVLLNITNTQVKTVFSSRDYLFVFDSNNISGGIGGVWANNNNFVFLTTWYSLYRKAIYTDSSQAQALKSGNPTILFGLKSRGTNTNNIFTIGSKNIIHHYNGTTFKTYHEPPDNSVTYYGLDVKTNISVTCGQKFENGISDKAIITFIKK
jgi:hypothetical protein